MSDESEEKTPKKVVRKEDHAEWLTVKQNIEAELRARNISTKINSKELQNVVIKHTVKFFLNGGDS